MVGMLPEAMVIDQVKEGQLQILETDLILDAQDYGILTRKDEPVSDIAAAFINILLKMRNVIKYSTSSHAAV